jgi:hypothetical protein
MSKLNFVRIDQELKVAEENLKKDLRGTILFFLIPEIGLILIK